MTHIRNQHHDIAAALRPRSSSASARISHQPLHRAHQLSRRLAPPADIVEAEMQHDDVRRVGRDVGRELVDVEPGGAAVDGEVRAAAAGREGWVDGGVVGAPGLWGGEVDVGADEGRERAVVGADVEE